MKNKLNPDAESLVLEFLEIAAGLERRLDRTLSFRGLTFSEYRILRAVAATEDTGISRIALANAIGLTPSAITRALKPLEKLGYVTTSRNERDARQSLALISRGGRQLLNEARSNLQEMMTGLPVNDLALSDIAELRGRLADFS